MKNKIYHIAALSLCVIARAAEDLPSPPATYTVDLAGTTYTVLSVDVANGYRVQSPDGRVIGIPAADPEQTLTADVIATYLSTPSQPIPTVPSEVSRRQLKEWLIQVDLIDEVETALNAIPDAKQKRLALNWWTESQTFRRDHALVTQLGAVLSLSSAQIDAAFIAASKL